MNQVVPSGFRDVLTDEALERERIARSVQDLFSAHGFMPIETPTLEVMDSMRAGGRMPASPFKFFDSRGDLLVMRPDVTMQVARMCATRLQAAPGAMRFRYMQRVFREAEEDLQAQAREVTQVGVECVGESGAGTDAELIELFLQAARTAGVRDVRLSMATVAPLRALLDRSGAPAAWREAVLDACHSSDFVELDRLISLDAALEFDVSGVAPAYAAAIGKLTRIRGGAGAIDEARAIVEPLGCADGLDALAQVFDAVASGAPAGAVMVDFSVMSSFGYYTGVIFEAYSPYLGAPLGSGGRYDNTIEAAGQSLAAAGFAFTLEQVMAAQEAEERACAQAAQNAEGSEGVTGDSAAAASAPAERKLRIAVPKGSLNKDAIACLAAAGLDTCGLDNPGRQLVISTPSADYIIVRPSDAPAFVAFGAADCGICGRDSLLESGASVVELVDMKFGGCRFVVAEPAGATPAINERYRKLGSIRIATKYPKITLAHFAKTGTQVDIVKLHGNIELAPLTGMADRIVDITATGTTLRENNLEIVEDVLDSTARFFANPCAFRTDARIVELAGKLAQNAQDAKYDPIAGGAQV
jgi:ATP phosphoribosyltransferase regulatory subunit